MSLFSRCINKAPQGRFRAVRPLLRAFAGPALLALAGCGGAVSANPNGGISLSPGTATIDTNCTGCNSTSSSGASEQFTLSGGGSASITWSVSGGDALSGPGAISSSGQYTPPSYLTANSVQVTVKATLSSNSSATAIATVTVTPGFLQPLTPENAALGANGTATITGFIAEAGGTTGINYTLSSSAGGSSGGQGALGTPDCTRGSQSFTYCTVTYTAPATIASTAATYVVATVGTSSSTTSTVILLNTAGINSDPASHETQLNTLISLGSSGGNNDDYDLNSQNQVTDCCGGTLGSLIQNSSGAQYILSCNHVLARSDQASAGETIVQPGLIDDNCSPYGQGGAETPVGVLTGFVPLDSTTLTNVDAAIAAVNSGAVSTTGSILELGAKQSDGTLASAPPAGGKGEAGALNMSVAKSGRTTGLTCAGISAVNLDVQVSYYSNCAETTPYYTKNYTNQIAISGNQFSDAGDSGSLIVDSSNAEPVGLFYAGGEDANNVGQGIANPVADVLSELSSQTFSNKTTYTFVGGAEHPVSCLNYGDATATAAQARSLTPAESTRIQDALPAARALINPSAGILDVAAGKSSDRAGEGAVIVFVAPGATASVPDSVNGVRTVVIPTTAEALAQGTAPTTPHQAGPIPPLAPAILSQAVATKQQIAHSLMKQNPAFFGAGVGQSLDNPKEAALVIYVDRRQVPAQLPSTIDGLRVRYVIMDRLHVTRSYATGLMAHSRCSLHSAPARPSLTDPFSLKKLPALNIY